MQRKPVRKAVIAAAGFGTRFLPQTKAMPKEMLPLIDKPIIQYVVEELVEAGIQDIIIVTGYSKRSIEDHFDYMSAELRMSLRDAGKLDLLEKTRKIGDLANFSYIRQKGPYGNATPLMNAAHLIGDEPFIYTFADDFFVASPSRFTQLIKAYNKYDSSVLCCKKVLSDIEYKQYGIVAGDPIEPGAMKISTIIEKPGKESAPSDMASVSSYLFTPDMLRYVEKAALTHDPKIGEFTQQPIIQSMIDDGYNFIAQEVQDGKYYDTGNKLEYLKTVVDFAVENEEFGPEFREYLRTKL